MISIALAALSAVVSQSPPTRTAFMCSIDAQRVGEAKATLLSKPKQIAFLLTGSKDATPVSDPIEVFDPDDLLNGGTFHQFHRREEGEYALRSVGKSYLMILSWHPREGMASYNTMLGNRADPTGLKYHGFCIPFEAGDVKKEFDAFRAEGGFK